MILLNKVNLTINIILIILMYQTFQNKNDVFKLTDRGMIKLTDSIWLGGENAA